MKMSYHLSPIQIMQNAQNSHVIDKSNGILVKIGLYIKRIYHRENRNLLFSLWEWCEAFVPVMMVNEVA